MSIKKYWGIVNARSDYPHAFKSNIPNKGPVTAYLAYPYLPTYLPRKSIRYQHKKIPKIKINNGGDMPVNCVALHVALAPFLLYCYERILNLEFLSLVFYSIFLSFSHSLSTRYWIIWLLRTGWSLFWYLDLDSWIGGLVLLWWMRFSREWSCFQLYFFGMSWCSVFGMGIFSRGYFIYIL